MELPRVEATIFVGSRAGWKFRAPAPGPPRIYTRFRKQIPLSWTNFVVPLGCQLRVRSRLRPISLLNNQAEIFGEQYFG